MLGGHLQDRWPERIVEPIRVLQREARHPVVHLGDGDDGRVLVVSTGCGECARCSARGVAERPDADPGGAAVLSQEAETANDPFSPRRSPVEQGHALDDGAVNFERTPPEHPPGQREVVPARFECHGHHAFGKPIGCPSIARRSRAVVVDGVPALDIGGDVPGQSAHRVPPVSARSRTGGVIPRHVAAQFAAAGSRGTARGPRVSRGQLPQRVRMARSLS